VFSREIARADGIDLVARVARSLRPDGREAFQGVVAALEATRPDILLEATLPGSVVAHVEAAVARGVAVVIATSGWDLQRDRVDAAARSAGVPVFYGANFSIAAMLQLRFAREAAKYLPDVVILEEHETGKLDKPSGTANYTARLLESVTGHRPEILSMRLPGLIGNQSVIFGGPADRLELRAEAYGRDAFVPGALLAIRRVRTLPPGLSIGMDTLLA
jgi:4-hydroxy-tetrahydrodipicolinate reductase